MSIVLREIDGAFVTHMHNHQDGGYYFGHYFYKVELWEALADFAKRCISYGMPPLLLPQAKEQIQEDILTYLGDKHFATDSVRDALCQIVCDRL